MIAPGSNPPDKEIKVGKMVFPLHCGNGRFRSWWWKGEERQNVTAGSLAKLRAKLEPIATSLVSGQIESAELDSGDHRAFVAAREVLAPYQISVDAAAREYVAMRQILGDVSPLEAARFYQRHSGTNIVETKVSDVVTEFVSDRAGADLSESYLAQLEKDVTRFSKDFGERLISDVRVADITTWLDTCGHTRRIMEGGRVVGRKFVKAKGERRNQIVETLATLFRFARSRHYLVQERKTQAEELTKSKKKAGEKTVISPADLRAYFDAVRDNAPTWIPYLAIAAFTGMRTWAILRLKWRAFRWESGVIVVEAADSKIRERYRAPIHPVLKLWLADYRKADGPVIPEDNEPIGKFTAKLSKWSGVKWRKNSLRSSYISYRFAQCGDAGTVAGECNTSAQEVRSEYLDITTVDGDVVTTELAGKWFDIAPGVSPSKIVQANFGA